MSATDPMPRSRVRMLAHTQPSWASDRIIELEAERDEAIAERDRLREREAHFAKVLGVTDGGEYRNDWDSRIEALIAERDAAREALTFIARIDPVDAALDPDRAVRIARAALTEGQET
jgi:hypothetical protein